MNFLITKRNQGKTDTLAYWVKESPTTRILLVFGLQEMKRIRNMYSWMREGENLMTWDGYRKYPFGLQDREFAIDNVEYFIKDMVHGSNVVQVTATGEVTWRM